ncbi:hypothetical protein PI126_g22416 [Phytophthora idaei]|nr:hypothetical protein PI126_g22416 [Phytophthora idaei]
MPNRQEIAGLLAALYLYRGSCCYSSGVCASLPLGDAVRQLSMTGYVCTLFNASDDVQKSKYRAVSNLDDYVFRPKTLEAGCLYEFTMWYFKKKSDSATSSTLRFLVDNPLCNTHRLGKRYVEVVPVIQGFMMPSVDCEPGSQSAVKRVVLSLLLFEPFRTLDLIGISQFENEDAWMNTFETWKKTRSNFVEGIMNNMQDYYRGLQKVEEQHKAASEASSGYPNETNGSDGSRDRGDDILRDEYIDGHCDEVEDGSTDEQFPTIWEEDESDIILESLSLNPAVCPTSAAPTGKAASIIDVF